MARYKKYSYDQGVMIPVDFIKQIIPGSLEYTIHWLVENKIDLTGIEAKYKNDKTGAPAYESETRVHKYIRPIGKIIFKSLVV